MDIRVELAEGLRADVEMQIRAPPALASRLVYYCARDYADQLHRGEEYEELTPTIVIVWLVQPLFPDLEQLHSVFELRERTSHVLFSNQLEIHLLQLAYLDAGPSEEMAEEESALRRWARFLVAKTDNELNQLAKEDPIMGDAKNALDKLSQDPEAYRLARERADAVKLYELDLAASRRLGREEGLRAGLRRVLSSRFGALPEWGEQRLASASLEDMERMYDAAFEATSLEDVLKTNDH